MKKDLFKNIKNTKVKRFLLFLFLATIFWVLTKFSREFTATMVSKIEYENIPEAAALSINNTKEITFDLTANGFEILFYKFKKPKVSLEVRQYYSEAENGFTINKNELMRLVSSSFNRNLAIKNLSIDELNVKLDPIVLKKVRVLAKTDITFKDGFKPEDSIRIKPDSVLISGPAGSLKNITTIETELISFRNIEKNISQEINILDVGNGIVSVKPKKVKVELTVAEFSQEQFILPVEVINLPPNIDIKMVPQSIAISFDVSVKDFTEISSESFRLVCDYSQRNQEDNFMLPFLEKKPEHIRNVVFEPKKVDFFIFK